MTNTITLPQLTAWVHRASEVITAHRDELTELDAAIGDADHGGNMARGLQAAVAKLDESAPATVADLGKSVGMTLVSTVGGASGPLFGTLFLRFGTTAGAVTELDGAALAAALRAGVEGVVQRGKAAEGDKTMLDAWLPALAEFDAKIAGGSPLGEAVSTLADAAERGRDATRDLVAHKGRASYLGERSAGHIDPGAASTAYILRALADEISAVSGGDAA